MMNTKENCMAATKKPAGKKQKPKKNMDPVVTGGKVKKKKEGKKRTWIP
jgi:hypothetical protein